MQDEIERSLAPLVGLPMWGAARTADVLSLQFGDRRAVRSGGEEWEAGAYALHVACPWRLAAPDRLLVGSGDLLTPADPDADLETFDWDEPGASWLDVRLQEIAEAYGGSLPAVEAVAADAFGGIRLSLAGGLAFEAFPNSTPTGHVATEFWRLARPGTSEPRLVVGTFGTEVESET